MAFRADTPHRASVVKTFTSAQNTVERPRGHSGRVIATGRAERISDGLLDIPCAHPEEGGGEGDHEVSLAVNKTKDPSRVANPGVGSHEDQASSIGVP
jgi:hypothetical protein